jgi:AcrR family transcriptional regulator
MSKAEKKSSYHHGDLREQLLKAATKMIKENGVSQLSLRKLASQVGVSRTAPYHHFKDKNELLCAIAEQGFKDRNQTMENLASKTVTDSSVQLKEYMIEYVRFAQHNPEIYELMFGRTIWKQQIDNQSLKDSAYPSFQHQLEVTKHWQNMGLLDKNANSLRLSQVIWGTMHGIAKLLIDGIYKDNSQIEEICACAAIQFSQPCN